MLSTGLFPVSVGNLYCFVRHGVNVTFLRAGMCTASPVLTLRPSLALVATTLKVPKPRKWHLPWVTVMCSMHSRVSRMSDLITSGGIWCFAARKAAIASLLVVHSSGVALALWPSVLFVSAFICCQKFVFRYALYFRQYHRRKINLLLLLVSIC